MTTLTIDGSAVEGIDSFYDEINRVFMVGEDWQLGPSLDALNDLLYGGYGTLGALEAGESVRVRWRHSAHSRAALGAQATAGYYREKLRRPDLFRTDHFARLLADLEAGAGPTYFDIVLDVFAQHPRIELDLD
ncbi:barstar family protein [Microbacterium pygmaeum]|uniref:Barstar, RNAse (Barnase) inhibitor n=1 Tax=Microbacterium pygmaeum TaxID=370764 RepID=A0A1G7XTF1_9MICO|nr:barstar family protein [Microbacterium pygmaeum]SDG87376.1 Barstar, RNAse (barnase) inhibitor [Microbacterium pygmaeum]